jgi:Flp pilus assembly protein TadG
MISLIRLRQLVTLKAFSKDFAKDNRGVSAIEFALVAPILLLAYLGLADLTLGMMVSRRASHLAATIGDLAAQSETLSAANVTDLWAIANSMMKPFPTSATPSQPKALLKIRITSVTMKTTGSTTAPVVNWSATSSWTKLTASDPEIKSITTTQIASGESLIVTDVAYTYDSPIKLNVYEFVKDGSIFKNTFYHHPRNGAAVACPTCL